MASEAATAEQLEEERRWVLEAQRGHLDAMRPIFERYASPLYATVILPRVGDAASAEDVLRDTFVAAVEKIASFQWQGKSVYAWLRMIAINKAYDLHRKTKRSRKLVDAMSLELSEGSEPESRADALLIADEERQHHRQRIATTMALLSERYRHAIELRLVRELSREQCAAELGVSLGTFDVLLHRAVRSFRKHFGARAASEA